MRRIFLVILGLLLIWAPASFALEVQRDKNIATYITFPLIDSSDDVSYKSGATGLDSEIDAFADGAAPDGFVDCTNEATEIGTTGIYYLSLTAAEMNNDYIIIQIKSTDANTQTILINTRIKEAINTVQADLDNPSQYQATGFSTHSATDVWAVGTRALTDKANFTLASSEYTNIWNEDISAYAGVGYAGTYLKNIYDNQNWDVWDDATRTLTAGTKDTEIDAIKAKTDNLNFNADVTELLLVDIRDVNDTTVTGVNDFKADVSNLDVAVSSRLASADITLTAGKVTVGTNDDKTGYSLSASGVDAIWDETITGHVTADSFGKVFDDQINGLRAYGDSGWATAIGFSTHSASDIWAVATRTVTGGVIDTNNDKTGYSLSSAGIDAIWDELQSGHTTIGTFGYYLDAQVSGVGGGTAADIADAVWDEALADHQTAGSAGKKLDDLPTSGTADFTANERTAIKAVLGVGNDNATPQDPTAGINDTIRDAVKRIRR